MTNKTLEQHIAELNSEYFASSMTLRTAQAWRDDGIHTPEQLDHHLSAESYINLYKSENNIKPRWIDFSELTTDQINTMIDDLSESINFHQQQNDSDLTQYQTDDIDIDFKINRYEVMAFNHGYFDS